MNINDAKKVMLDKMNLEIEFVEIQEELRIKGKQIKKLESELSDAEYSYGQMENSRVKQFFLGLLGKKEARLQELQNEVRKVRAELTSAQFEFESLQTKSTEIEMTRKEIEDTCAECLHTIREVDGDEIKTCILSVLEVPRLCAEISQILKKIKPLFTQTYDVYMVGEPTPSCLDGTANNRTRAMRKQTKIVAGEVDELLQLLNAYNLYAPEEIKIEFHDKWIEKDDYWENQVLPSDSLDRVKVVENWFHALDNKWNVMRKKQKATMKKVEEEVLAYLDN